MPLIYGQSATDKSLQELRDGSKGQLTGVSNVVQGWIAADTIARILVGDDASVWEEGKLSPFRIYNSENVGDLTSVPEMPAGYDKMFADMWGL